MSLFWGVITGIAFGFLLQKGHVLRYEKQVGVLRLIDMTIVKFMLSAIVVASVGIYFLNGIGWVELDIKSTSIGAQLFGGIVFGIGWGLLGYCPGTAVGALGEGRIDGLWGIFGMLAGGGLYAYAYPFMKTQIEPIGKFGKISLPGVIGFHPWVVILALTVGSILLFRFFEKRNL
ncbi:MAG: DUF6691 family protein [Desulfobacterales bacterium]